MDFYSSREERLNQASSEVKKAYEKRGYQNFFKKNPQIKILMFDLIIIVLFSAIIVPLFMKITQNVKIDHYNVESKALVFEENLLITIKLESSNRKKNKSLATQKLKVVILNIDNVEIASKTVDFPKDQDKLFYITFKLDEGLDLDKININLETDNFHRDYKVKIQK